MAKLQPHSVILNTEFINPKFILTALCTFSTTLLCAIKGKLQDATSYSCATLHLSNIAQRSRARLQLDRQRKTLVDAFLFRRRDTERVTRVNPRSQNYLDVMVDSVRCSSSSSHQEISLNVIVPHLRS